MPLSTAEYAKARDAVGRMLDELRLKAYLYELEPADQAMKIKIECALDGVWEVVELAVDSSLLLRSLDDAEARRTVRERLRAAVAACLPPDA